MANSTDLGRYWLMYLQPEPESGEKIAAALVFQEGKRLFVDYDAKFAKVHKVYPNFDLLTLQFYLDSLGNDLGSSAKPLDLTMSSYGPQIVPSEARRISTPISQRTRSTLRERYLLPEKPATRVTSDVALAPITASQSSQLEIEAFVRNRLSGDQELLRNVNPKEIAGRSVPGTKPLALAIRSPKGWTVIDGVDLNKLSPTKAEKRADEIGRIFWSYTRVQSARPLTKIGIVLNGNSHVEESAHEAHDYALHRFQVESDLAIDGSSPGAGDQLKRLLQEV